MSTDDSADQQQDDAPAGITEIAVQGFKSLYDEQRIEVRPLTILAGANNSGKSSIMQPLLMMKQTLEATYDPGPLKLNGPNVYFTAAEEFLTKIPDRPSGDSFSVGISLADDKRVAVTFEWQDWREFLLTKMTYGEGERSVDLDYDMKAEEIFQAMPETLKDIIRRLPRIYKEISDPDFSDIDEITSVFLPLFQEFSKQIIAFGENPTPMLSPDRCFVSTSIVGDNDNVIGPFFPAFDMLSFLTNDWKFHSLIRELLHVPAVRDNSRTYRTTATAYDLQYRLQYDGTFEHYVASIIEFWQNTEDRRLVKLGQALESLGLTWTIEALRLNDVNIELFAGRLPQRQDGGAGDLVNIADMGVGVSQVLPALVALLAAIPGQLVYLEHPERDLHPRAQVALAQILAEAAQRGVRVVVETHSSLLLLGVQTLVAEGKLPPDHVALHWFKRGEDGATTVTSADLDEAGAFGDWPEDFADVDLESDSRYPRRRRGSAVEAGSCQLEAAAVSSWTLRLRGPPGRIPDVPGQGTATTSWKPF